MFKKILVSFSMFACLAFAGQVSAAQDPSLHEVYQAAQAGRLKEAQDMMKQVLIDHPNSGKAHYVEAELMAKQGNTTGAATELATAERLSPGLLFAKPEAVQNLRDLIARPNQRKAASQAAAPQAAVALTPASSTSMPPLTLLLIGLGVIAVCFLLFRAMRRGNNVVMQAPPGGAYPSPMGQGAAPVPGFGSGNAGYGGQPGYGAGGVAQQQAPASAGSGLMGSLATGAALGAGVVAGQALMHRFTDSGSNNGGNRNDAPADNSSWTPPPADNMGGSDFGVADNSSWDDAGSSSGGGGDDWDS
ncbi:tetratricopeptide repeat protein [Herbaspirillum sp. RTI4]|uniref:tetratricopeptide repeat protein n=1 Tax=Herbaspirillum sp. RTI4 TaxID=3048640 RepID=UPI002AB5A9D2|nr:tetratricopeptide repeat protein [Herbaspirillum sp. RTI4]MDY7578477.1 tetratricopeptide repeat protein [Herbaspirillum sp. RTI4]MEA9981494.1 tetratricopeptide repeat protein [Herbaspirillum sp. RTI4]